MSQKVHTLTYIKFQRINKIFRNIPESMQNVGELLHSMNNVKI